MDYGKTLCKQRIAVFGASRGIGFNLASNFIAKGSDVVISSGNADNLNNAFLTLQKTFPSVQSISKIAANFDVQESMESSLNPLLDLEHPFDSIIISSAVLGPSGDFANTDFTDWVNTFNVNVFGPAKLVQYFLKNNLIRKNGKIIIISGGISGADPYFISFSSTKHALNGFAYSLAHQLAKKDIWLNSVLPGSYHTDMNKIRIERGPESIGQENFQLALSRVNEDETAKYQKLHSLVEFLCSPSADGIYGRLISAQYDDWQNNIKRLKNEQDDLYKITRKKD